MTDQEQDRVVLDDKQSQARQRQERTAAALTRATVIDVHAHAVLDETMGAAGTFGPELAADEAGQPFFRVGDYVLHGVRYRGSPFMDVELRLAAMDERAIDFQVLSPNPLTYFHFIDERDAVAFCRCHNDALATLVAAHPERLAGFAALPMQAPAAAVAELHRAVLELGLWGGYIGTDFGRSLDDPAVDEVFAAHEALNVPLFVHPAPAGIDGPAGDSNLKRFDLDIVCGFAAQETLAVATLIYGGVLHRHPALDVCISHGGGASALLYGRMADAARKRPWAPDWLRADGAFEEQLHRLWFDVHMHDADALALATKKLNAERFVYGTNFAGWDAPPAADASAFAAPFASNARRLLRDGCPAPAA